MWRVGNKVALNVYENDEMRFMCRTPEDAARVVALLLLNDAPRLKTALERYGHHAENCNEYRMRGLGGEKVVCNCGLDSAFEGKQ